MSLEKPSKNNYETFKKTIERAKKHQDEELYNLENTYGEEPIIQITEQALDHAIDQADIEDSEQFEYMVHQYAEELRDKEVELDLENIRSLTDFFGANLYEEFDVEDVRQDSIYNLAKNPGHKVAEQIQKNIEEETMGYGEQIREIRFYQIPAPIEGSKENTDNFLEGLHEVQEEVNNEMIKPPQILLETGGPETMLGRPDQIPHIQSSLDNFSQTKDTNSQLGVLIDYTITEQPEEIYEQLSDEYIRKVRVDVGRAEEIIDEELEETVDDVTII